MVSSRRGLRRCTSLIALFALVAISAVGQAHAGAVASSNGAGGSLRMLSAERDAWISAEASYLSGRKLSVVCAATSQDWAQALPAVGFASAEADQYYGFSLIALGEMHLSPYVCEGLRLGILASTRRSNELQVAWSVNVLVHESVHMGRFIFDEALAEACARVGLPVELHRLYGVAYHSPEMSRLTFAATLFRRTQETAYEGGTCSTSAA